MNCPAQDLPWSGLRGEDLRFAQPRIKGAKPGDLAKNSTKFELMIKLQTGKALGIAIPLTLLASPTR
jgi:hypothetical protein